LEKPKIEGTRLNKYIANAGICNRRKADEHIAAGKVKVNGKTVTKMGIKVQPNDEVFFEDQLISAKQKALYYLINKPKDYASQKNSKKNIWQLISQIDHQNFIAPHPLSSTSCGLSLLTNDDILNSKFKSSAVKKLYYLQLEEELTNEELINLKDKLDKSRLKVAAINFVHDKPKSHIGIELYDKADNDILRLLMRSNLNVLKLDRVMFAGITKKDLSRGQWRHLTEKEIITLKHF